MNRRTWAARTASAMGVLVVAVVTSAVLAAIVSLSLSSVARALGSVQITVRPASGVARTHFAISFRAPRQTGTTSTSVHRYELRAVGGWGKRCASKVSAPVPATRRGEHVRVILAAPGPFRAWCSGTYRGSLEEISRPVCARGKLCPMYIATAIIGRFSFRVR